MLTQSKLSITTEDRNGDQKRTGPDSSRGISQGGAGGTGTSQAEFARAIGVSPMRISHVVNGTRPVTAELALLFGRAFGQTPQYWLKPSKPLTT